MTAGSSSVTASVTRTFALRREGRIGQAVKLVSGGDAVEGSVVQKHQPEDMQGFHEVAERVPYTQ